MIDIIFTLSLMLLFAVCSVTLIIFGADVYQKLGNRMESNYESRTSIAFFFEKFRQNDSYDDIRISEWNNTQTIEMFSYIDECIYVTRLYEYDGYLCELFSNNEIDLPLEAGQKIMEINELQLETIHDNLFLISFSDINNNNYSLYVSVHSTSKRGK